MTEFRDDGESLRGVGLGAHGCCLCGEERVPVAGLFCWGCERHYEDAGAEYRRRVYNALAAPVREKAGERHATGPTPAEVADAISAVVTVADDIRFAHSCAVLRAHREQLNRVSQESPEPSEREREMEQNFEVGRRMLSYLEKEAYPQMGEYGTVSIGKGTVRAIGELKTQLAERTAEVERLKAATVVLAAQRALWAWAKEHEEVNPPSPVFHRFLSKVDGAELKQWRIQIGTRVEAFGSPEAAVIACAEALQPTKPKENGT